MASGLNTLSIAHRFIKEHARPGQFWVDGTAGRGYDTAFLCELVGSEGRVLSFDIQQEALESTKALLAERGLYWAHLICDSHSNMDQYLQPGEADGMVFNFGYLPGGDHRICTKGETSIAAIEKGLSLLRTGGVMSLCIYYGGDSGFEEKDALLKYLKTIDSKRFTVLLTDFYNRPNCPPMAVFILKDR